MAAVAKAQHDPQDPWFFIEVVLFKVFQSKVKAAESFRFLYGNAALFYLVVF